MCVVPDRTYRSFYPGFPFIWGWISGKGSSYGDLGLQRWDCENPSVTPCHQNLAKGLSAVVFWRYLPVNYIWEGETCAPPLGTGKGVRLVLLPGTQWIPCFLPSPLPVSSLPCTGAALPPPSQCARISKILAHVAARCRDKGGDGLGYGTNATKVHRPWAKWWSGAWQGGASGSTHSSAWGQPGSSWWWVDNQLMLSRKQWTLGVVSTIWRSWGRAQGKCPHRGTGGRSSCRHVRSRHELIMWWMALEAPHLGRRPGHCQSPPPSGSRGWCQYNAGFFLSVWFIQRGHRSPCPWMWSRENPMATGESPPGGRNLARSDIARYARISPLCPDSTVPRCRWRKAVGANSCSAAYMLRANYLEPTVVA